MGQHMDVVCGIQQHWRRGLFFKCRQDWSGLYYGDRVYLVVTKFTCHQHFRMILVYVHVLKTSQLPKYTPHIVHCLNFIPRGCTVPPSAVNSGLTSAVVLACGVWTDWDDTPVDVLGCTGSTWSSFGFGGCFSMQCVSNSVCNEKLLRQYLHLNLWCLSLKWAWYCVKSTAANLQMLQIK